MDAYRFEGRQVYSNKSGKLVANLDGDGNPVMVKGMAGAHSRKLAEFLNGQRLTADGQREEENASAKAIPQCATCKGCRGDEEERGSVLTHTTEGTPTSAPRDLPCREAESAGNTNVFVGEVPVEHVEKTAAPEEAPKTTDEFLVSDIPEADLPEFLPELGAENPEVKEFIRRHRLTARQIELLIRRCEKRR